MGHAPGTAERLFVSGRFQLFQNPFPLGRRETGTLGIHEYPLSGGKIIHEPRDGLDLLRPLPGPSPDKAVGKPVADNVETRIQEKPTFNDVSEQILCG